MANTRGARFDSADAAQSQSRHTMGASYSSPSSTHTAMSSLNDLHEEALANVMGFMEPRDVEALTVASKVVARDVVPRFPIWKRLFCYRWSMLNFELARGGDDNSVAIELDEHVRALAPGCSESRLYQLLAHAITPVPSFIDVRHTERVRHFSSMDHQIEAIGDPPRRRTLDIAYAGRVLGGDRCVRANVPFDPTFRVAVYAVSNEHHRTVYRVGIVSSGYFEISIRQRRQVRGGMGRLRQLWRHMDDDMTAIGIGSSSFPLIDKQPGWDRNSFGYHGDDGHYFHRSSRGRAFAEPFGVGDTVGCGIRRDADASRSFVYFTKGGRLISRERQIECDHSPWYPVIGLDSHETIHVNFGQEPFARADAVDSLFAECEGQHDLLSNHMSWYSISASDADSSSEQSNVDSASDASMSDEDGELDQGYIRLSELSDLAELYALHQGDMMDDEDGVDDEETEHH